MELEIYGDESGYSAYGEYQPGVDTPLQPCPFCGANDGLTVSNTHTPYYSVECECSATIWGDYEEDAVRIGLFKSKKYCELTHRRAFQSAIDCWNTRSLPLQRR